MSSIGAARGWIALCALMALVSLLAWPLAPPQSAAQAALEWQPSLAWAQPWRWWSAAAVHLSPLHLGANLAGCGVLASLGHAAGLGRRWTLAWVSAWPLTHLGLVISTDLTRYAGLSGVLHAGVALASLALLVEQRGRPRLIGALILAGLLAKVALERPWAAAVQVLPGWDFAVAPLAHATGTLAGLGCGAVAAATRGRVGGRQTANE